MENKTAESTEELLTTDPFLVDTIVETLTIEVEGIKQFQANTKPLKND